MLTIDVNQFRQALDDVFPCQTNEARARLLNLTPTALDQLLRSGKYDDRESFGKLLDRMGFFDLDPFILSERRTARVDITHPNRLPASQSFREKRKFDAKHNHTGG